MNAVSSDPIKAPSFNNGFASSQGDNLPSNSQPTSSYNDEEEEVGEDHPVTSSPKFKEPTTISLQTPAPARMMETSLPTFTPLKPSLSFHDPYNSYASGFSQSQPTPGYLANRWNMSSICGTPNTQKAAAKFMTPSTNQKGGFMTPSQFEPEPTPNSCPLPINFSNNDLAPTPPSNNVRLSLSLDGRASLVSADMSSSPPRAMPPRPTSALSSVRRTPALQRSLSATAAVPFSLSRTSTPASTRTPLPTSSSGGIPRLPSGRSRDATRWQLCADTDARDELTTHADNESNGSAVAAISLIRSTSGKALKPNSNKRNATSIGTRETLGSGKKVKRTLGRGISALGRLQSGSGNGRVVGRLVEPCKEGGSPGDSDKENWVPGEGTGSQTRHILPSIARTNSTPSKAAADSRNRGCGSTPLTGRNRSRAAGKKGETKVFEDVSDDEADENERREKETSEEVERFMRGASPGKKGDLDCIQGLLSLSQGNWR